MFTDSPFDARAARAEIDGLKLVKAAILCLFLIAAISRAAVKDITGGFDEVAHVSYVAHLQKSGDVWPDLTTMRLIDPVNFNFGDLPNYLNHPSPYYWLLARLGPTVENNPASLLFLRAVNVGFVALGLAALLLLGKQPDRSRLEEYGLYVPLFAIPVLAHLAGAVNNDNLAFLGGAVAFLAAQRLLQTREDKWLVAALLFGMIASLAKLTALLLVGGLVAGVLTFMIWRGRHKTWWIAAAAVAALIAASPYLALWAQYGGPAPDTPGQILLLKSTAPQDIGWENAPRLSFPGYAAAFAKAFIVQWVPTPAERNMLHYAMLVAPVFAIACAVAGFYVSVRRIARREEQSADVLVAVGFVFLLFTLACHLVFSYRHHVVYAYVADAYPRYYLPLGAVVPLAGLSLLSAIRAPRRREALNVMLIAAPLALMFFGVPSTDAAATRASAKEARSARQTPGVATAALPAPARL